MKEKNYNAILLDTSMFIAHALKLESGLLEKLSQFADGPILLLVPDVIKNEILYHITEKIRQSIKSLEKSINDAKDHVLFDTEKFIEARNFLTPGQSPEELAQSRLDAFLKKTNAKIIDCNNYTTIELILRKYFKNEAPFAATGKKKNEFPDAITLLAVEEWAKQNEKIVLAVAKDKDWENFCTNSTLIDYIENLSDGLSKFQEKITTHAFIKKLKEEIEIGQAADIFNTIEYELKSQINWMTPDQEATSHLFWEPEGISLDLKKFNFQNMDFKIINAENEKIVVSAMVNMEIRAEGEFALSIHDSIDRDYVSMGTTVVETTQIFDSEILITFKNYQNEDINDIELEKLEIVDKIHEINFDEIEPNFDFY